MYRFGIRMKRFLLVIGDVAIYQLALVLTLWIRYGTMRAEDWGLHALPFGIVSLLWVIGSYIAGLYDLTLSENTIRFFRLYLESMIANLTIAFVFFYLTPFFGIAPRTNLILYFSIVLLLGYGWRLGYNRFIANTLFRHRVLFIGKGADVSKMVHLLEKAAYGFELVAVIETAPGNRIEDSRIQWFSSITQLESVIQEQRIDTVILGHHPKDIEGLSEALYKTLFLPVTLLDRAVLEETLTGRVPLEYISQTWFLDHLREGEKTWYESMKRGIDLVLAIPVALITLTLLPFIALGIKLSSPGSILYFQERIGRMGKPFIIWKFRTMRQDAEAAGTPQWATENDPRITRIGSFLRATRLDELPQIWNVLRGDMSMIGPRPERPKFVDDLTRQMPFYALRHLTRPGVTGWAQVKFPYAGNVEDNLKKLQYDLYYIKHRSLFMDLAILLKTVAIVLKRQGT